MREFFVKLGGALVGVVLFVVGAGLVGGLVLGLAAAFMYFIHWSFLSYFLIVALVVVCLWTPGKWGWDWASESLRFREIKRRLENDGES